MGKAAASMGEAAATAAPETRISAGYHEGDSDESECCGAKAAAKAGSVHGNLLCFFFVIGCDALGTTVARHCCTAAAH
jgi:hypothetical protein